MPKFVKIMLIEVILRSGTRFEFWTTSFEYNQNGRLRWTQYKGIGPLIIQTEDVSVASIIKIGWRLKW